MARWRVTWGGSRGAGRGRRSGEEGEEGGGAGAGRRGGGGPGGGSQPRCFLSARGGGEPRAHPPCLSPPARSERLTIGFKSEDEERILRGGGGGGGGMQPGALFKRAQRRPGSSSAPLPANSAPAGKGKVGGRGGILALISARGPESKGAPLGAGETVLGTQLEISPLPAPRGLSGEAWAAQPPALPRMHASPPLC